MMPSSEKVLRLSWELPLEEKAYEEIGRVMVHIIPLLEKVEIADSEGAILKVKVIDSDVEDLKELRSTLYYIDLWFEGEEDPEQIRREREDRLRERLQREKKYASIEREAEEE
uniref:Uncharacterized protein n=1 Tax=Saccharolobus islandicus TaxID=43080 RepID=Q0ZNN7_SACIS|nr:hypothetical protein [Sulfolobus islandicus]ABE99630.1 hypothetical protein [Sulfolobus islandicus]ABE99679.1 hypothetical protein [Sulfolobus islandicus]